MVDWYHRCFVE